MPAIKISAYVTELILKYNAMKISAADISAKIGAPWLTPYQVRKYLKSQPGIFVPPKKNPNPPIDQTLTYKILNLYSETMPLTLKQIKKYRKSHRKPKIRKYSQRDIANKLDISQTTVWNIIHANRTVDIMRRRAMQHAEEEKAIIKFRKSRMEKKKTSYMPKQRGRKPIIMTPDQFQAMIKPEESPPEESPPGASVHSEREGCQIWQGPTDSQGYGRQRWGDEGMVQYTKVNRIAATLCSPPLLTDIYDARRIKLTCANPKLCCNTAHMTVSLPVKPRTKNKVNYQEAQLILTQINQHGLSEELKSNLAEQLQINVSLVNQVIENPELIRNNKPDISPLSRYSLGKTNPR